MTMKPCPRCQKLIPHGMAYCAECRPIAEQIRQERREENRKRKQSAYNRSRNKTRRSIVPRNGEPQVVPNFPLVDGNVKHMPTANVQDLPLRCITSNPYGQKRDGSFGLTGITLKPSALTVTT